MKWRFQWLYRFGLAVFFAAVLWSVWASAQSVTNIPPAPTTSLDSTNRLLGEWRAPSFGLDDVKILNDHAWLGQPLWKYAASLVYLVLAFLVAGLLDFIVNHWLKRLAAKTQTKYDDLILELLRGPVKVVAFVILLHIGLGIFDWPPRAEIFFSRGLIIIVACAVTYVVLKLVDLALGMWRDKVVSPQDKVFANQLVPLLSKSAKIAIVIAAALLTAENLSVDIKTLLAGLSVGGLALGLAAQDTVANLFGAVAVFLDKPFYVGDRIKVEGVEGAVELIGLRSTRVRNADGFLVSVPNKLMGNAVITNLSRRASIRTETNLGLATDTPAEKIKRATEILEEIFRACPRTADLIVSFNIFIAHVWNGTDAKAHFAEMQELNLKIKQRFDAEKIEFASSTHTVNLKNAA
jgi:MscS family membrane protein